MSTYEIDTFMSGTHYAESRGYKEKKYGKRGSYAGIVVHTTSKGPLTRWNSNKKKYASPFHAALHIYCNLMTAGPHYVIGPDGELAQVCPEDLAAWHVGGAGSNEYVKADWWKGGHEWWKERYSHLSGPSGLGVWGPVPSDAPRSVKARSKYGSVNAHTIGIEVVPNILDLNGGTNSWGDACSRTLSDLVSDICFRRNIPESMVYSHSEVHPLSRTSKNKPWDPSDVQWETFKSFHAQRLVQDS